MKKTKQTRAEGLMRLYSLIPEGEDTSISMSELAKLLGCDHSVVRAAVQDFNDAMDGELIICSIPGYKGYFIPRTPEEAVKSYRMFQSRLRANSRRQRAFRNYFKRHSFDPDTKKESGHDPE